MKHDLHRAAFSNLMAATMRTLSLVLIATLLCGSVALAQSNEPLRPGANMPTPGVSLYDVQAEAEVALGDLTGERATVVIFWSNQCPWIERYQSRLHDLRDTFVDDGVSFVLVNANDADAFRNEGRTASREHARSNNYDRMHYLRDDTAALATAFGAQRTPHAFVFNANRTLVYVGAIDDSPAEADDVNAAYLRNALNALVENRSISESETRAFGCLIKLPR